MLTAAFFALALGRQDAIHPAFLITKPDVDSAWTRGYEAGKKRKDLLGSLKFAERQIDSYHVSMIAKQGCSWAWFVHPKMLVYARGFDAGKQYWSQSEIDTTRAELAKFADGEPSFVGFYVSLTEMPSFDAAYGRLSRYANPDNLTDVRCVLKVGDRIIQPTVQPGNLTLSKSDNVSIYSIPNTAYISGSSTTTAHAYGSGGYAYGNASSSSSYTVTTYSQGADPYSTYSGAFYVLFPLRDESGKAQITPSDKEVELVVIKKSRELHAKYKLNDWLKAFG